MHVIEELLAIKSFREHRAELAVLRQRQVLQAAQAQRQSAARRLDDFAGFALERERGIYADLCRRLVRLRDIEAVQEEVAQLRTRERQLQDGLARSLALESQEERALGQARQAHDHAARVKDKFIDLAARFADEALQALERAEDAEMAEVAELRRDRAEWDVPEEETQ